MLFCIFGASLSPSLYRFFCFVSRTPADQQCIYRCSYFLLCVCLDVCVCVEPSWICSMTHECECGAREQIRVDKARPSPRLPLNYLFWAFFFYANILSSKIREDFWSIECVLCTDESRRHHCFINCGSNCVTFSFLFEETLPTNRAL